MQELKPCPFCGGDADEYEGDYGNGIYCMMCGAMVGEPIHLEYRTTKRVSIDEAIDAWNTRSERTCHVVKNSRKYVLSDGTELFDDGCSICNGYIGAGENYCSNCGAKVTEEDTDDRQRD